MSDRVKPSTPPDPLASSRHPLESIASDFADSIRGGKQRSIDDFVESNPKLESELRELLPVIHQLERARQTHVQRPGGLASLGAARPDRLGDFEFVRQIGRGGMGVVFEAVQKSLGRRVALKVLPKSLLTDDAQLKRFEREARTAGSLHHTNIVPVFGVGEDQGFHYYVMQRIDGRGLDRLLSDEAEKLTPKQVASLGQQAASALAYAHQQNVLHRDIKPANLIVNHELQLWVTDFGVAKAIESEAVTRTGDVVGTLRYIAPEQIVGDADVRSGYCRSGDLGFIHDGQLYVTGRIRDVIILRGRNLFPQDIESTVIETLGSEAGQCAALAVEGGRGEVLAVVAELPRRANESAFPQLVRDIRRTVIEVHEVDPHHLLLVRQATIPLTSSGKVRRSRCREMFNADQIKTKYRYDRASAGEQTPIPIPDLPAPASKHDRKSMVSAIEAWMTEWLIVRAGVQPSDIDLEKPFGNYGLDSMTAVEMSGEIEDWSGIELTPVVAWDHPTVSRLSSFIVDQMIGKSE